MLRFILIVVNSILNVILLPSTTVDVGSIPIIFPPRIHYTSSLLVFVILFRSFYRIDNSLLGP